MNLSFEDLLIPKLKLIENKKVLVAFSGGKDSLALLDFLNCYNKENLYKLYACHINHNLRENAYNDEIFCKNFCQQNNITFKSVNIGNELHKNINYGIEDTARKYRYKALFQVAEEFNCDYILTAHTFDDQIESFFVDLYTGSSIFTLGGIAFENNKILRLILDVPTNSIYEYLNKRNLKQVEDESNIDIRFIRNNIRHNLLPSLYGINYDFVPNLLRLQEESSRLNKYFEKKTEKAILHNDLNLVEIDKEFFYKFEDIEKEFLLSKLFSTRFRFTKQNVKEVLKILDNNTSSRIDLPNKYIFEVSFHKIRIFKNYF